MDLIDVSAKIISEVYAHPQLYDKKNPSFKFKYLKEEIWAKIGSAVNLDGENILLAVLSLLLLTYCINYNQILK